MKKKTAFICGILGCLCFGAGDWLMLYGDPSFDGAVSWLTRGASRIPQWRYSLAMALAFPGILLYGAGLFATEGYIRGDRDRKVFHYLNVFGMTPWLALHLFYILILSLFARMHRNGYASLAGEVCLGVYSSLAWVVPVSEAVMFPVFLYWFYLEIRGRTVFPAAAAFTGVPVIFLLLKGISLLMPVSAFRLGFTNGLMSESMLIWFLLFLIRELRRGDGV